MKEFKKYALKALLWEIPLLLLFCISMVLITGKTTHAASQYDNAVNLVSNLNIEYNYQSQVCDLDVTGDWESRFLSSTAPEQTKQSFRNARDNGAVSVSITNYTTQIGNDPYTVKDLFLTWVESRDNAETIFYEDALAVKKQGSIKTASLSLAEDCTLKANNFSTLSEINISTVSTNNNPTQLFQSNYPATYPPDYAGPQIPAENIPQNILRPNITAEVNAKSVAIRSRFSPLVGIQDYKIYWFITNANFDGQGPEVPFSLDGYSNPEGYLTFEVPAYGVYNISAYFKANDGTELADPEGYVLAESSINVNIDGSIFAVNTDDMECNENNFCEENIPEWIPEECIIESFPWVKLDGCVRNVLHWIGESLGMTRTKQNPTGSPFVAFQSSTFGLTAVISAPLQILRNISNSQYSCSPITLPLPHLNRSMILPCLTNMYQTSFTTLFTMYQSIVGGIISYYVMTRVLELIKMMKDPKNDKIEVLKL